MSPQPSTAFDLLDSRIQKWVYDNDWQELRDIQEQAIPVISEGDCDALLASSTASGKTEAAFLPICSDLVSHPSPGARVLYLSPLKALINDQYDRLTDLCGSVDLPVTRWHGDVPQSHKSKFLKTPAGVLLITPESLEAMLVGKGTRIASLFQGLAWAVVDEVHAYVGSDRGRQVQSLLSRVEGVVGRRVPRVGLSATLGDLNIAAEFLRPGDGPNVRHVVSNAAGQELKIQVRGVLTNRADVAADAEDPADIEIARHLFKVLRGRDHLVFANTRRTVERLADLLRRFSEATRVPVEFVPHHGSLAKELREDAEARLKDPERPTTAICTSTLELGIDVGQVSSIGQVGAPFSVASMRQRLGRSGRRGEPSIFRAYITEQPHGSGDLLDDLHPELVQTCAMVELLLARWCEPPRVGALHLSTLVQQVLSMIAERGGIHAKPAWKALCEEGPFRAVESHLFTGVLRCMGEEDLIMQSPDGTLLLGEMGERVVSHFSFYSIFETPEEFRVFHGGRELGTIAFDLGVTEGLYIVFAGRRWRIVDVDGDQRRIDVEAAPGGRIPRFEGGRGGLVHDRIRREMWSFYQSSDVPAYLDSRAREILRDARLAFSRSGLGPTRIVASKGGTLIFLCCGDEILQTVALQLRSRRLEVEVEGPAIRVPAADPAVVEDVVGELARRGVADAVALAGAVSDPGGGKYDWALDRELSALEYSARGLDVAGAARALRELLQ